MDLISALSGGERTRPTMPRNIRQTSKETEELASKIPFWPETIGPVELSKLTGICCQSIAGRVASCHDRYLIFTDHGRLSRLKRDLSNCDYKENPNA
jgi:hypothetical protein